LSTLSDLDRPTLIELKCIHTAATERDLWF